MVLILNRTTGRYAPDSTVPFSYHMKKLACTSAAMNLIIRRTRERGEISTLSAWYAEPVGAVSLYYCKAVRNLKSSASFCAYVNMDTCRKVCVTFLMIIVTSTQLCVAEQDTTLPYILPARVTRQGQQQGTCPAQVDLEIVRNSSREDVVSLVRGMVNPITCPCGGLRQWTRIAYLNMSDPTQQVSNYLELNFYSGEKL